MKKNKLIYIEWADAYKTNGSFDKEEVLDWCKKNDYYVYECGWLIEENKEYILFATELSPHYKDNPEITYRGLTKVPKTWIRKKIDLTKYI